MMKYEEIQLEKDLSNNILENYKLGFNNVESQIGRGTFGKVRIATHLITNEKVKF